MSITSTTHQPGGTAGVSGSGLDLQGLSKAYGPAVAVSDVSFSIQPGEFVTLLGPSGSGKSTILKMIAGFEQPSSGHILLDGESVEKLEPGKRNLGMVFQNYALFPHMTVLENVAYGLKFRRMTRTERLQKANEMLELVQMTAYAERLPKALSGGQQQRIALARALAIRPRLLLMDEPLGALDRSLRLEMSAQIKKLHRETRTTFLYVTHDQEEALLLSDRVAIMKDSKLVSCDSAEALYNAPPDPFTAEFFGNCNRVSGALLEPTGGRAPIDPAADYYFHQEHVRFGRPEDPAAVSASGRVSEILFMGSSRQVIVELARGTTVSARVPAEAAEAVPSVGDDTTVHVTSEHLHGFHA